MKEKLTSFELNLLYITNRECDNYIGFNNTIDYRLSKYMSQSLKRFYNKERKQSLVAGVK